MKLSSFFRAFYFLGLLGCVGASPLSGALTTAPFFADGMVLPRDKPIPVWGKAAPEAFVDIAFGLQKKRVQADKAGDWQAVLDPQPASGVPAHMHLTSGDDALTISDVLVGDLWLIAGQSNMAMPLSNIANAPKIIANAQVPLLREFKIKTAIATTTGEQAQGLWRVCDPQTAGKFSAVGYYVGKYLVEKLDVPIGLINASWGGSVIEGFLDVKRLESMAVADTVLSRWETDTVQMPKLLAQWRVDYRAWRSASEAAKKAGEPFAQAAPKRPLWKGEKATPGGIYLGMIYPLTRLPIAGVLWYQGESNAVRHYEYADLLGALIGQWRADFNLPDLPFYIVQLPPYKKKDDPSELQWAYLRQAQAQVASLPNTYLVVTIDQRQENDIHPRAKQTLSRRLANLVLKHSYGHTIAVDYPAAQKIEKQGDELRLFLHNGEGLFSKGNAVTGFAVAGVDGTFFPTTARIDGANVLIKIPPTVSAPAALRYAFSNAPAPSLYNGNKLPLGPFSLAVK